MNRMKAAIVGVILALLMVVPSCRPDNAEAHAPDELELAAVMQESGLIVFASWPPVVVGSDTVSSFITDYGRVDGSWTDGDTISTSTADTVSIPSEALPAPGDTAEFSYCISTFYNGNRTPGATCGQFSHVSPFAPNPDDLQIQTDTTQLTFQMDSVEVRFLNDGLVLDSTQLEIGDTARVFRALYKDGQIVGVAGTLREIESQVVEAPILQYAGQDWWLTKCNHNDGWCIQNSPLSSVTVMTQLALGGS